MKVSKKKATEAERKKAREIRLTILKKRSRGLLRLVIRKETRGGAGKMGDGERVNRTL